MGYSSNPPEERLGTAFHMLIINAEHYVRGLAAQGSTKIENGVRDIAQSLAYQKQTTDRGISKGSFRGEKKKRRFP